MPSSKPTPDTVTATLGSDSLLQASLLISVLISRSIGPSPATGPSVLDPLVGLTNPDGPAGWLDTCVT
jgi:hypothetical protein